MRVFIHKKKCRSKKDHHLIIKNKLLLLFTGDLKAWSFYSSTVLWLESLWLITMVHLAVDFWVLFLLVYSFVLSHRLTPAVPILPADSFVVHSSLVVFFAVRSRWLTSLCFCCFIFLSAVSFDGFAELLSATCIWFVMYTPYLTLLVRPGLDDSFATRLNFFACIIFVLRSLTIQP
jgi:hypothetical protein